MTFKAVIFDIDGVLADSDEAISRSFINTMTKHGFKAPTKEKVQQSIGADARTWIINLLPDNKKQDEELIKKMTEYSSLAYKEVYMPILIQPAKNAIETLKKLQNTCEIAIATNNPRDTTEKLLKIINMDFVKTVVTSTDVENPKPAADPILKAIKELNAKKEECLFIGDTLADIQAANAAGISVALKNQKYNQKIDCKIRITELDEVFKIVNSN